MQTLITNARLARHDDRDYLVASLTMLVPGVLNGSGGPVLYRLADIREAVHLWNGVPLTHGHPPSPTARDPHIIEQYGLGSVHNSRVTDRLIGEAWFDVLATQRIEPRILGALQVGSRIEVSTGLRLTLQREAGIHNDGRAYYGIGVAHKPDHLAILINSRGACSIADGCGVHQ